MNDSNVSFTDFFFFFFDLPASEYAIAIACFLAFSLFSGVEVPIFPVSFYDFINSFILSLFVLFDEPDFKGIIISVISISISL